MIPIHIWNTFVPVGYLVGYFPHPEWNIIQCYVRYKKDSPLPPTSGSRISLVRKAA